MAVCFCGTFRSRPSTLPERLPRLEEGTVVPALGERPALWRPDFPHPTLVPLESGARLSAVARPTPSACRQPLKNMMAGKNEGKVALR